MIARAANYVWRIRYARYLLASGSALAADLSLFMILLSADTPPAPAAATGYMAGLIVHWLMSSRFVFSRGPAPFVSRRRRQKILFVLSAFLGLSLTSAVVGVGSQFGLDPRLAKLIAIAISFQATYILRRSVVFA